VYSSLPFHDQQLELSSVKASPKAVIAPLRSLSSSVCVATDVGAKGFVKAECTTHHKQDSSSSIHCLKGEEPA